MPSVRFALGQLLINRGTPMARVSINTLTDAREVDPVEPMMLVVSALIVLLFGLLGSAGFALGYVFPRLGHLDRTAPPFPGEWWQLPSGDRAEVLGIEGDHVRYRLGDQEHTAPIRQFEQQGRRWGGPPELVDLTERP